MTVAAKSFRVRIIIVRVIAVVILIPSLLALAVSWWAFNDSREFLLNSGSAEGTVINIKQIEGGSLNTPVISFRDQSGKIHTFEASIATSNPSYEVDEKVPIVYDLDDPTLVRIDYWATHWGFASMAFTVFIIGVVLVTIFWIVIPAMMQRKLRDL